MHAVRRPRLTHLDQRIIGLALPALGSLVAEPLYNLTDTAILGHLGRAPLGGLALAATVLNLLGWTAAFLEMATTSQVAYHRGRGDVEAASRAAVSAYVVAIGLGIVIAVVVVAAGPEIARLLGGHGEVERNATTYLRISAIGMPFLLVTFAGTGQLQGHENTRTPLRIVLVANALNVVLELLLVYAAGLGVAGSAWGTVAAQAVAAGLFAAAARRRLPRRVPAPRRADFAVLLRDGIALVTRTIALGAALTAATSIAARVGVSTLGAHQIAMQVWILWALVLDSLAVPAQVYVSSALGGGDVDEAVRIGARCMRLGLVASGFLAFITVIASPLLPALFSSDGPIRDRAMVALVICGLQQPLAAVAFVYDGLLLGAADYATLRRAMLLALVAFTPLAAATLADHRLGIAGIWLAITCWLAARCVLLGRSWATRNWATARL
jgi:putative MATE family efflux protein